MRGLLLTILLILIGFLLALWSPWRHININISDIFGVEEPDEIAGLQIYALSGELAIYVDRELVGEVSLENSPYILDRVTPGEHLVKLVRKSTNEEFYWTYSKLITFEEGATVVISYNIGPEKEFSEGHVIFAMKTNESFERTTQLSLVVNVPGATVSINNIETELTGTDYTQAISLERQYSVMVSKEGFEPLEFTLLPEDEEMRESLKDYDVHVDVQLMYQPVQVE